MKAAIASAVLAAIATGAPNPVTAPATISVDVNSWGRRVVEWSIDARGEGRYSAVEPNAFARDARWVVRRVAVGPKGYRQLRALLASVERRGAGALPCTIAVTDGPYGDVRWSGPGGERHAIRYLAGCREPATQNAVDAIFNAGALIRRWSAKGEIIEDRKVTP
ncbi:hypothetical protein AB2M62_17335 [Sphingomonas sp. MMS12-HWE2-04]|uniref:hypothetical protein n=1 Tax=Sphingomonas sp. MMS12-HWE2-04 TaxID=3234199 RepID=UPI00384F257A